MDYVTHKKSQEGASLIEVIVSMFMVVVLFVLYLAAMNTVALVKRLSNENIAYHVASKQIEVLRETAFTSLPSSGTISDPQLSRLPSASGSYTISNYSSLTGVKEITITVIWNDGKSRQVVLKSLAGSGGINP